MKYFTKQADLTYRPKKSPETAKITAGGIFIGTQKGHERKSQQLIALLKEHKSLRKTRDAYQEMFPDDYTTMAFKTENAPKKPWIFGRKKYKKNAAMYADKTSNPRVFLNVGKAGGPRQTKFYTDILRGTHTTKI